MIFPPRVFEKLNFTLQIAGIEVGCGMVFFASLGWPTTNPQKDTGLPPGQATTLPVFIVKYEPLNQLTL